MARQGVYSVNDIICAITEAVDLVSANQSSHHKKVAWLSRKIALEMKLGRSDIQDIVLASMAVDIFAFLYSERDASNKIDRNDPRKRPYAIQGYELIKDFDPLAKAAEIIMAHHLGIYDARAEIPVTSHIIHLADSAVALFDKNKEILEQIPDVLAEISREQNMFRKDVLAAFENIAHQERLWMEAFSPLSYSKMIKRTPLPKEALDLNALMSFVKIISNIIDFRNSSTATHSSGVAAVAGELAKMSGFSERECMMMEIAGFLHDLGKLAIPNEILEKREALNAEEFNIVKQHPYYTHAILSKVKGFEHIATWAAYHHERQDGKGYPFRPQGENFPELARIMAVADTFTALTEDRPYRMGMGFEEATATMFAMAETGGIDDNTACLVIANFDLFNDIRKEAQEKTRKEYDAFIEAGRNDALRNERRDGKTRPCYEGATLKRRCPGIVIMSRN